MLVCWGLNQSTMVSFLIQVVRLKISAIYENLDQQGVW
jgi:hypothetical protein